MLYNTSLKTTITVTLCLLVLISTASIGFLTWNAYQEGLEAQRLIVANRLADKLITSASIQALERGVTATALSGAGEVPANVKEKIQGLRQKGDSTWQEAMALVEPLNKDLKDPTFELSLKTVKTARSELESMRQKVDASLNAPQRNLEADEWIRAMSAFIAKNARLRLAAFPPSGNKERIEQYNLIVKQAVWLASEYAGFERATLGSHINSKASPDSNDFKKLASARGIVEHALSDLKAIRDIPSTDARIVSALDKMEANFSGEFESLRKQVYADAQKGQGQYSVDAKTWIARSTEGINSILAVAEAVSQNSEELAIKTGKEANWRLIGFSILFVLLLIGTGFILNVVFRKIQRLIALKNTLAAFDGDLTLRLAVESQDEMGDIAHAFNVFMKRVHTIVSQVHDVSHSLSAAATELSSTSSQLASNSSLQSDAAASTAAAVEEVSTSIQQVSDHVDETVSLAEEAFKRSERGANITEEVAEEIQKISEAVNHSSSTISLLNQASQQIGGFVQAIREIADQTNLLALNAAIEAARAGETGRGFAVVADEVRKLAERTSGATAEITALIGNIHAGIGNSVSAMDKAKEGAESGVSLSERVGRALGRLQDGSAQSAQRIREIANVLQEQNTASQSIATHIEHIARMAEENSLATNHTANAAHEIETLAAQLEQSVRRFRV